MKSKNKKGRNMNIIEYIEEVFKSCGAKVASYSSNYATGLMTSQKRA